MLSRSGMIDAITKVGILEFLLNVEVGRDISLYYLSVQNIRSTSCEDEITRS